MTSLRGCRAAVTIIGAIYFSSTTALAQPPLTKPDPQASIGFLVPVYLNPTFNTGQDESDSGLRSAVGIWGDFIVFASPRVAFHTGLEFPTSTTVNVTHHGTAGFTSVLHSRQVALYEMVGFHSATASKVQASGLVGFGLVISQFTRHSTNLRAGLPNGPTSTHKFTRFAPSIMGGVEVPISITDRIALVAQIRGRVVLRKAFGLGHPYHETFGWLTFTPGIGVQFR
jgi:hypothetical protein